MVFVKDDGSEFDASIDKVWRLNQSEGEHNHPSLKNPTGGMDGEHPTLSYETKMPDGSWVKHKLRLSLFPPVGVVFETIEGPLKGSTSFQIYTPKGNKTGVTIVGEWTSPGVPDAALQGAVMQFLETVFREDVANLSKL